MLWFKFSDLLLNSCQRFIQMWKCRGTNRPQWLYAGVKNFINWKQKLWKEYTKTKSINDLNKFKTLRKLCKKKCFAKVNFEERLAGKIKENPKAFHSYSLSKLKTNILLGRK